MLVLNAFNLAKCLTNGSQRQTIVQIVLSGYLHLASTRIRIVQFSGLIILVTLHSICLATASLTIREDGCMETVDDLRDEAGHLQCLKHLLLTVVVVEYLVETIRLLRIVLSVHY